jgi:hypothetical protein
MARYFISTGENKEVVPVTEVIPDQVSLPQPEPSPPRKPWYRRAAVIIPLVLVLVAAAVVTTVLVVARGSTVIRSATPVVPNLSPVRAAVTSALTGKPLPVTLKLPGGAQMSLEANGTVVTNRIKPGDTVTVSAEGYLTAQAPMGSDRTITAILRPTFATATDQLVQWAAARQNDQIINYVLSSATGFQYQPLSAAGPGDNSSIAARVVGQSAIVNITVDRGIVVNQDFLKQFYGDTTQPITIAGQPAWHGSMGRGVFGSTWVHDPLLIDVNGADLSATDTVLTGIVAALPAN